VDRWAEWALDVVHEWPDDPSQAEPDVAALRRVVRRLERRAALTHPHPQTVNARR
jgi:hypothetical protein